MIRGVGNRTIIAFIFGATIGAGSCWYLLKDKYEKKTQEEIDSVKEFYYSTIEEMKTKTNNVEYSKKMAEKDQMKPDISEYVQRINNQGYTNYSNSDDVEEDEEKKEEIRIVDEVIPEEPRERDTILDVMTAYVIHPDEFGEIDDYRNISLTFYSGDDTLVDDDGSVIDDVDSYIGSDSLKHFGEFEEDVVYVRNDTLRCDFEVLLDYDSYENISKTQPRPLEVR